MYATIKHDNIKKILIKSETFFIMVLLKGAKDVTLNLGQGLMEMLKQVQHDSRGRSTEWFFKTLIIASI